jgi:hypothetical protein
MESWLSADNVRESLGIVMSGMLRMSGEWNGIIWLLRRRDADTKIAAFGKAHQISTTHPMLFESSLRDRKESDLALRNFGDQKITRQNCENFCM